MASKVTIAQKSKVNLPPFNDIGWSSIALFGLLVIWGLTSYQSTISAKYVGLISVFYGILLAVSLAGIMLGVWKARFRWKFLSVAIAVIWLIPFTLYVMSFAGPFFYFGFTW